ncbi:universal stress protein [Furfurilactobacillus sp. WILCCON 0119]
MSFSPKQILVPLDGSENAEQALTAAIDIAKETGAHLHLIRVYLPAYTAANIGVGLAVREFDNDLLVDFKAYLKKIMTRLDKAGVTNVEAHVVEGNVKKTIALDYPAEHQIDLIVIGATGMDAFSQTVLGSVTDFVVNKAKVNVMVVKRSEADASEG